MERYASALGKHRGLMSCPRGYRGVAALWVAFAASVCAQTAAPLMAPVTAVPPAMTNILPSQPLGADDMVELTVSDCPALTRSFRVGPTGTLTLPLLKQPLAVGGLTPPEVAEKLRTTLVQQNILVDPVVNVSVLEYRSRPISILGAVNHPITFQATGRTTLLDALATAGGLAPTAGGTVIVTSTDATGKTQTRTIETRTLIADADPAANLKLIGGEEIRVPEGQKIFVTGNVVHPGMYPMQSDSETTVVKAIALSSGLSSFTSSVAYISRRGAAGQPRATLTVPLKQIMAHKTPDVTLLADDILYVPVSDNKRVAARVLSQLAGLGQTAGGFAIVR